MSDVAYEPRSDRALQDRPRGAVDDVRDAVTDLFDELTAFKAKLDPVLKPEIPVPAEAMLTEIREPQSEIVSQLERLRMLKAEFASMRSRLEV